MRSYDLNDSLAPFYSSFPEAKAQPVVGITANWVDGEARLNGHYYKQVAAAGGTPVLIPPLADRESIVNTLGRIDGLLLTGGGDFNPLWQGEEPSPRLHAFNAERDEAELLLIRLAANRQIPMLGICRGIQALATALGGKVIQDDRERNPNVIKHSQEGRRGEPSHSVQIEKDSTLYNIYGAPKLFVNSDHHQSVGDPGKRFRVVARAADGVVEAMESVDFKQILGVQWHPEWLGEEGLPLFQWLVRQANNFNVAKGLHRRVITLDTHCDTPMFFHQGVDFATRDERILVDLHKMHEGRLDATTMVAYLPQPKMGETFSSKVKLPAGEDAEGMNITPFGYANLVFDHIERIVKANSQWLSIARTPSQLYEDKRNGRKSIMLGIENGLAVEQDLGHVRHFAQRGVVYITLCHNGDNYVCDSARGNHTHDGVSQFGAKVIKEMNRMGIMVDLSHASEKSFYDALDISSSPVVCSHSNCKALCDVPRNLSDDQLRALAAAGGVAHTTLYRGFLRTAGQATLLDAMDHLEHAIRIMGIEHVGLGTDFDGDGGVPGFADASEALNFTLEMLRRKYSEADIRKIWGGNWLRVMAQAQNQKE